MNKLAIASLIGVGLLAMALAPLVMIWAINTLFATNIAFTFLNWFAALVILIMLRGSVSTTTQG